MTDQKNEFTARFALDELVLFLFQGNLIHGIIVDAEYSELNYEPLYEIEFEDTYGDGETYIIAISESQLVTPPEFLSPPSEDFICDECLEQILENPILWDEYLPDSENKTSGNCLYTIFPDDEEEAVHIEIDPDFYWTSDDIWELIDDLAEWATLLEQVPEEDFPNEANILELKAGKITSHDGSSVFDLDKGTFEIKEIRNEVGTNSTINVSLNLDAEEFVADIENLLSWISEDARDIINKARARKETSKENRILIVRTNQNLSLEETKVIKDYVEGVLKEGNIEAVALVLPQDSNAYFA